IKTESVPPSTALLPPHDLSGRSHLLGARSGQLQEPIVQAPDSLLDGDARPPAGCRLELARVRHVIALVAGTPILESKRRVRAADPLDVLEQLDQAQRPLRAAADVERMAGKAIDGRLCEKEGVDQIVDEEDVAPLQACAVEREPPPLYC